MDVELPAYDGGKGSNHSSLVAEGKRVCYRPCINIVQGSPIEILVEGTVGEYIELNNCFLWVRIRIVTRDGLAPGADLVAPVNNILHSMWSSVELELNNKNITGHGLHYPYRAYLENLLSYSPTSMNYQLQTEGWHKDKAGHMNSVILTNQAVNTGLRERAVRFNEGRLVELYGRLHLDIFHQESLLPPGVPMKLKLTPSAGRHCLMTLAPVNNAVQIEYRIFIEECQFHVKKIVLYPHLTLEAHKLHLNKSYAYCLRTPMIKLLTLANNIGSFRETFITTGQIPQRVYIAFISQAAHDGSYQENTFNFQHFDMREICV